MSVTGLRIVLPRLLGTHPNCPVICHFARGNSSTWARVPLSENSQRIEVFSLIKKSKFGFHNPDVRRATRSATTLRDGTLNRPRSVPTTDGQAPLRTSSPPVPSRCRGVLAMCHVAGTACFQRIIPAGRGVAEPSNARTATRGSLAPLTPRIGARGPAFHRRFDLSWWR